MPRQYHRKTERGHIPIETLNRAARYVAEGKSMRAMAKAYSIDRMTLKRFVTRKEHGIEMSGYGAVAAAHQVFSNAMELDLAVHFRAF